jgi:hypothetical protein
MVMGNEICTVDGYGLAGGSGVGGSGCLCLRQSPVSDLVEGNVAARARCVGCGGGFGGKGDLTLERRWWCDLLDFAGAGGCLEDPC